VYFTYKDYRENNKRKVEKMHVLEFMRRFFFHIVPKRFMRIRYFGLLSNRNRSESIRECREYFEIKIEKQNREYTWIDIFTRVTGRDPFVCPKCKTGRLSEKYAERIGRFRDPPEATEGV
jgi:hypothetical protein